MWFTPASLARRSTFNAVLRSFGGPNTPGPGSCIAPNPMRPTYRSPRRTDSFGMHIGLPGTIDHRDNAGGLSRLVTAVTRLEPSPRVLRAPHRFQLSRARTPPRIVRLRGAQTG